MVGKVWVFAEADEDKVTTATLEMLTKVREVGETVEAIYAGKANAEAIATTVAITRSA